MTTPPFAIGKPFVRQPRGDTRVTPEDKQRAVARRAAEVSERRAAFEANNDNWEAKVVHWHPCTRRPVTRTRIPSSTRVVHGGEVEKPQMSHRHKPNLLQTYHELFPTQTGVTRCLTQPPSGEHWPLISHPRLLTPTPTHPSALHTRACPSSSLD